jgi:hypothetical protein
VGALIYFTRELPGLSEDLSEHGFQVYEALAVSEVFYLCEQHPRLIVVIDHTVEPDSAKEIAARSHYAPAEEKSNGARCGVGASRVGSQTFSSMIVSVRGTRRGAS